MGSMNDISRVKTSHLTPFFMFKNHPHLLGSILKLFKIRIISFDQGDFSPNTKGAFAKKPINSRMISGYCPKPFLGDALQINFVNIFHP